MATFARYILDQGFKATVLTATGGDGEGNAIGPEAGRSLALIRVEEERRALALVGVASPSGTRPALSVSAGGGRGRLLHL